jgi:hypothetical protein
MKLKLAISAIAACALMGGTAMADGPKNKKHQNKDRASAASVAGGVAAAGPRGAVAGGGAGNQVMRERSGRGTANVACVPGTASTSTNGAVYTSRRSGSAAINTSGTAAGSGAVSSSSEGEVYSSTDRQGSQADAYGNSTATADRSRRC